MFVSLLCPERKRNGGSRAFRGVGTRLIFLVVFSRWGGKKGTKQETTIIPFVMVGVGEGVKDPCKVEIN